MIYKELFLLTTGLAFSYNTRMEKQATLLLYMPNGGESGALQVWDQGDRRWVEFRGRPYSQWGSGDTDPFQQAHDALEGWHATVLHTDEILALLPKHPDYSAIRKMVDQS